MRTHNYYPTKIADVPVTNFTKKELLILLDACVWALNHDDNIYGGLICNHTDKTFDPMYLTDLSNVEGYHQLLSIIRSITVRLIFTG